LGVFGVVLELVGVTAGLFPGVAFALGVDFAETLVELKVEVGGRCAEAELGAGFGGLT
jgi:hypothetical protein